MTDADRPTLADVSHTHPDHETRDWHWFRRGPAVAADGGRRDRSEPSETDERDVETERMGDVSHTPADGDGANRVWDGTRVYDAEEDADDDE